MPDFSKVAWGVGLRLRLYADFLKSPCRKGLGCARRNEAQRESSRDIFSFVPIKIDPRAGMQKFRAAPLKQHLTSITGPTPPTQPTQSAGLASI
jgi:hypothetical protein